MKRRAVLSNFMRQAKAFAAQVKPPTPAPLPKSTSPSIPSRPTPTKTESH